MSGSDRGNRTPHLGGFGILSAILVCGAIIGLLAYLQGQHSERNKNRAEAYVRAAKEDAQRTCGGGMETGAAFECIYEKVESSKDQENTDQDLTAQFRAADSALFSAVFSLLALGITGVGVWFVKRTLDATLEAVEDTGKATKAMVRSNEIAQNTQRPWISIDAELTAASRPSVHGVSIAYNVTFKNTGSMIANNFVTRMNFIPMNQNATEHIKKWRDLWVKEVKEIESVLIPNETINLPGEMNYALDAVPWFGEGPKQFAFFIIMAAVFYRIPYDNTWRMGFRAFSIGMKGDPFRESLFPKSLPDDLCPDHLILKKFGVSYAT
jgi:head-tail adaptor